MAQDSKHFKPKDCKKIAAAMAFDCPIVLDHSREMSAIVGTVTCKDGRLDVQLNEGFELTQEQVWSVFGDAMLKIFKMVGGEEDQPLKLSHFQIIGWSASSKFFSKPTDLDSK